MKRTLEIRRPVPSEGIAVSQLSAKELRDELDRRINQLQAQREECLEKAQAIEAELESLGVRTKRTSSHRAGTERSRDRARQSTQTRRANKQPLVEVLSAILMDGAMTAKELADGAIEAGYVTSSKNFTNSVSVALYRDPRFTKSKDDGLWRLAS